MQHGAFKMSKRVLVCGVVVLGFLFPEEYFSNSHLHSCCWSIEEVRAGLP